VASSGFLWIVNRKFLPRKQDSFSLSMPCSSTFTVIVRKMKKSYRGNESYFGSVFGESASSAASSWKRNHSSRSGSTSCCVGAVMSTQMHSSPSSDQSAMISALLCTTVRFRRSETRTVDAAAAGADSGAATVTAAVRVPCSSGSATPRQPGR
jgi:hypothetical protein